MKLYIGVTDINWYNYLAEIKPDEVNFWQPGGKTNFKAVAQNDLFLFKLHSPQNYISGGGFFLKHSLLPVSLAWEAFGNKNGIEDYNSLSQAIHKYRRSDHKTEPDPTIGCIILVSPFFFEEKEWIPVPEDWKSSIVQGKTYDTESTIGRRLYAQVQERIVGKDYYDEASATIEKNRFGKGTIIQPRLGQGAFRIMVTEAYHRRCAITGEKTLPVLDAAHIKPFIQEGPHMPSNGLLLRKDLHTLYDRGYITITENYHIEVSKRIKEDYGNGKVYYAMQGHTLAVVPNDVKDRPAVDFIKWHNDNVFLG